MKENDFRIYFYSYKKRHREDVFYFVFSLDLFYIEAKALNI